MFGLFWRALATVATLAGGALAQRALSTGWKAATGSQPPDVPENPDTDLRQAVVWAVVAGAVLNLARVMATRWAARFYSRRAGGALPRGLVPKGRRVRG